MEKTEWYSRAVEVATPALISLGVGMIRLMMLIRDARRRIRLVDILLEPSLAVFAGMLSWSISKYAGAPEILQSAITSVGAYGGTKTVAWADRKLFGMMETKND